MSASIRRILQIGVALLVLNVVGIAILFVIGILDQGSAVRIGVNVSGIIGICIAAGLVLAAVFAAGGQGSDEPG